MNIKESLKKFGLTSKESSVYEAALELGKSTAHEIAKKAGLPRSTTYSVIETLINKRLIFLYKEGKIKQYTAEDPQKIVTISQEATQALKAVLPDMKTLYKTAKGKPHIKYYEGLAAIKEMYNDILRQKNLKEYLILAAEQSWIAMDEQWIDDFKKRRASKKIKTRLITEESPLAQKRQKDGMKYLSEVRILDSMLFDEWTAGIYIFHDKVVFIEYKKDLIAVEMQSKGVAQLLKIAFESIWKTLPPTVNGIT